MSNSTVIDRGVSLAKGGDTHALGSLLEGYRAYLKMLAGIQIGRGLQSKFDADDLLQEVFLRAHQAIGRFQGTTQPEFQAWLRGILSNVLADQIRRYRGTQRRDPNLECALELELASEGFELALEAPISTPSQRASRQERAVLLAEAMQRLPAIAREVLVLRHFQEMSFPDIARTMGRTLDGVKNLWIRALTKLRREMRALDERD